MKREDRDEDRRVRAENYQRGLIALYEAVQGFLELTGVDLTGDTDITGRHMGEAPYLKITAERLVQITAKIEGDIWQASESLAEVTEPCVVLPFERPVLSARRPGMVTS
jgi:hypothetical protein